MSFKRQLQQLKLLVWKNFISLRHQKIALALEIGLPLLSLGMLIAMSSNIIKAPTAVNSTISALFDLSNETATRMSFHCSVDFMRLKLAYAPQTDLTDRIMKNTIFKGSLQAFATLEELNAFASNATTDFELQFMGAVVFDDTFANGTHTWRIPFTIKPTSVHLYSTQWDPTITVLPEPKPWYTASTYEDKQAGFNNFAFANPRVSGWLMASNPSTFIEPLTPDYWCSGFMHIQNEVETAIRLALAGARTAAQTSSSLATSMIQRVIPVSLAAYPWPQHRDMHMSNPGDSIFIPMALVNAFVAATLLLVRRIVLEKELRLKEYMRAMGLNRITNWCSHFLSSIAINLPFALLFSFVIFGIFFKVSNWLLIFLLLLLHLMTLICFAFALSCCFRKGNWAAICSYFLFNLSVVPYFVGQFVKFPRYGLMLAMLLPNSAMGIGFQVITRWENLDIGAQLKYLFTTPTPVDVISLSDVYLMQIVQILAFLILTWYIEAVFPGDEGVPQPAYFPFMPSYWFPKKRAFQYSRQRAESDDASSKPYDESAFEAYPAGTEPDIIIEDLKKVYAGSGPKTVALKNLNLKIFPGQITALLGHNGAGKSTTMAVLTGLTPATAGNATIKGFDVTSHVDNARQFVGLCPQYNVHDNNLTVMEHLKFFCQLKGRTFDNQEALNYLRMLNLEYARNFLPKSLSGGMKRKLSLAIALIGGSEIVMLDEPTSGMDPGARHDVWTFLQREKHRRTILLTTHYMEEADVLGDRIAILANGRLACSGTSMFLKRRYGAGYHITVAFTDANAEREQVIGKVIARHCPNAKLDSNIGTEAAYTLPSEDREKFQGLFSELENKQTELGVSSFGISVTTMDEVFIKVGEEADVDQSARLPGFNFDAYKAASTMVVPMQKHKLILQHLKAQLAKRLAIARRSWSNVVAQIVIPALIFVAVSAVFLIQPNLNLGGSDKSKQEPALTYSMAPFEPSVAFLVIPPFAGEATSFLDEFASSFQTFLTSTSKGQVELQQLRNTTFADFQQQIMKNSSAEHPAFYRRHHYLSLFVNMVSNATGAEIKNITAMFNDDPYHTAPIALNALSNALTNLGISTERRSIQATILPFPKVSGNHDHEPPYPTPSPPSGNVFCGMLAKLFPFLLQLAVSVLAGSLTMVIVKERINSAKHLQFMAGLQPATYWFSSITVDFLCYLLPVLALLVAIAGFGGGSCFFADGQWIIFLLVCLLHGLALIPFAYLISFLFQRVLTAFIAALLLVYFSSYIPFIAQMANPGAWGTSPSEADRSPGFNAVLDLFLPNVAFMHALSGYVAGGLGWSSVTLTRCLVCLVLQAALYTGLILAIDYGLFRRLRYRFSNKSTDAFPYHAYASEDIDVAAERQRIEANSAAQSPTITAASLSKSYASTKCCRTIGTLKAVDRLSFGVNKAECFGLLGVNGAGKTSTFQMLCGVLPIDSGDVTVQQLSVKAAPHKAASKLGYCPQFDALVDVLTTEETLFLFARLRGYPEYRISALVTEIVKITGLEKHFRKQVKDLSGGNRRKLSFGVALIGNPPAIILDEPTSGIDPVSRRLLWKVVDGVKQMGVSVLLSSHSMEECEALCSRIAIMSRGSLICLGTAQHLKTKFGSGYTLTLRAAGGERVQELLDAVKDTMPAAILKEQHQLQLIYEVPRAATKWSEVFAKAHALQSQGLASDYSASQSTLEQVFLRLTREAESHGAFTYRQPVAAV